MQEQERINKAVEMIVCPVCHGRLEMQPDSVRCTACGRSYPVEDGIPVLLEVRASRADCI
ncbi:MAG TPA: Trm112 family protein [Acidobacteriaceae bacterium]|nr:Trm112 family protein [Acidobacteriaceae bacterium]